MTPNDRAFAVPPVNAHPCALHPTDLLVRMALAADAAGTGPHWPRLQAYVRVELRRLAEFLVLLEKRRFEEDMGEDEAKLWAYIAVHHAETALAQLELYGLQGIPQVVGAAVAAVRDVVNGAVGFEVV
ncbi:MAG: hypothetical protein U0P81_11615 [Holophagaceae bacterium]